MCDRSVELVFGGWFCAVFSGYLFLGWSCFSVFVLNKYP